MSNEPTLTGGPSAAAQASKAGGAPDAPGRPSDKGDAFTQGRLYVEERWPGFRVAVWKGKKTVCLVTNHFDNDRAETRANAYLHAAAPDLLNGCRLAMDFFRTAWPWCAPCEPNCACLKCYLETVTAQATGGVLPV